MLQPDPIGAEPKPAGAGAPAPSEPRLSAARLVEVLGRARRRQRAILLGSGALAGVAFLLAATAPLLALAARGSGWARPLFALALAVAAGLFVWFGARRARREAGDPAALARHLAARASDPLLKAGLLPAVELREELERPGAPDFSSALARAHIESMGATAGGIDLRTALPDRPVRLAGAAALAAVAVLAIFSLALPDTSARGWRALLGVTDDATARARAAEPITGDIELSYSFPAYTRLSPKTVPNTNGEIAAPKGTEVRLRTRADREVAKASIVLGEVERELKVEGGRSLSGALTVLGPGSYRFRFHDARGRVIAEGPPIPIALEQDAAPKVEILSPETEVEVDPKSQVSLRFEAEDDFGLSDVSLLFRLPGASKPQRIVLRQPNDGTRRAGGEYSWDIVRLGAMPGDRVEYYLEATDNDEVNGKKTAVSKKQHLKIYSESEHRRKVMKQIEESWEKLVLLLADRLEGPDRTGQGRPPAELLAQSAVDARATGLASEMGDLARELRKQKAPEALWHALANLATSLGQKATASASSRAAVAAVVQRGATPDPGVLQRLGWAISAEIAEEERGVLYLETLVDRQRVDDLVALAKDLAAKRRDLGELLERYRNAPDDAVREKILSEIARLKERMSELMERMAELSKGINDEHVNTEAMKEMNKSGQMMGSFDKIQEMLHNGRIEDAMKELEKLGQMLDDLQNNLEKASGDFQGGEFKELAKDLDQFAGDLDQLESNERRLLEETQEVRSHYKKQFEQKLAQKGEGFVDQLRKKVNSAEQRLQGVGDTGKGYQEHNLRGAQEQLDDVDNALKVKDFDQAARSAEKALSHLKTMKEDFSQRAESFKRTPELRPQAEELQKDAKAAESALTPMEDVRRELASLFPPPGQAMSEADKRKMQQIGQQQGELREQASKLQQQMAQLNEKAPLFPQQAQQMMQSAGERMQRARGQLQERNPTGAGAEQRAALDQLGELKKGLQKQRNSGGAGGQSVPWPWMGPGGGGEQDGNGQFQDQKVEIPRADQYQVPEEYRKDILDAMKQGAPERYREQVKRYYEEIVK